MGDIFRNSRLDRSFFRLEFEIYKFYFLHGPLGMVGLMTFSDSFTPNLALMHSPGANAGGAASHPLSSSEIACAIPGNSALKVPHNPPKKSQLNICAGAQCESDLHAPFSI
jgi:hypothetical protein